MRARVAIGALTMRRIRGCREQRAGDSRVRFDSLTSTRPSPHSATRGYSRPVAAVTSRHQRVAVWPLIPLAGSKTAAAPGHGHYRCRCRCRCRRQVARHARPSRPFTTREGGWKRSTFNFQLSTSRCLEWHARLSRPPRSGWAEESAICNLQSAIRNSQFAMGGRRHIQR